MYTCWETKRNLRPANYGSRIDYILCSSGIRSWFSEANIQEGLMGSDHCPVYGVLSDKVVAGDEEVDLVDLMNPKGMFDKGVRLREWTPKDSLPLSARLIPEFDRRRNIRDMFLKRTTSPTKAQTSIIPTSAIVSAAGTAVIPSSPQFTTPSKPPPSQILSSDWNQSSQGNGTSSSVGDPGTPTRTQPPKRTSESITISSRPLKKSKPVSDPKKKLDSSQTTLKGFFKPKASQLPSSPIANESLCDQSSFDAPPLAVSATDKERDIAYLLREESAEPTNQGFDNEPIERPADAADKDKDQDIDRVFDPIENKESWSKLLGKRVVPKCEHGEPCISLVTKKPGVNCGRSFYICPRPLGPSGEKEKGTEWRCGMFVWSSDWSRGQAHNKS
jgi:AP endonuclease-2